MHVVSREEMQAIDHYTIEFIGLQSAVLMENAGREIFRKLFPLLSKEDRIGVVVGKGSNGGDGFVLARYLIEQSFQTEVWVVPDKTDIMGDTTQQMAIFLRSGGGVRFVQDDWALFSEAMGDSTVIIDALLGTGIQGEPRQPYLDVIRHINRSNAKIVAIDLPSGVPANGGRFDHDAVRANHTFTLQCPKLGMYTQPAARHFGDDHILDIGIPTMAFKKLDIKRRLWTKEDVLKTLPRRDPFSHKGTFGKGLLIAGSEDMPGAAVLSAKAALRSGIGLLTVSAPEEIRAVIAAHVVEATYASREGMTLDKFDGIALGPGLGRNGAGAKLTREILMHDGAPLLIDADGLFHVKEHLSLIKGRKHPVILTPHPGEMAKLADLTIEEVENDRFDLAKTFAEEHHVTLVLKGKYTLISTPDGRQVVNETGNPALAKGGTGDVLTGMIFAFMLQSDDLLAAVSNAVALHGAVAEHLTLQGHSMLDVLASDVIDGIPMVLHNLIAIRQAK